MGRSPPFSATALLTRRGAPRLAPARGRTLPAASHPPPRSGADPRAEQTRPAPQPRPGGPAPRPAANQGAASAGAANHGGAGCCRADLSAPPRPCVPAPGSRRDRTSRLAVGRPGCWEGWERTGSEGSDARRGRGERGASAPPRLRRRRVRRGRAGGVRERLSGWLLRVRGPRSRASRSRQGAGSSERPRPPLPAWDLGASPQARLRWPRRRDELF